MSIYIKHTLTLIILFRINDWRKTHTRRTRRDCINLSLTVSQDEIQLLIYKCKNSVGKFTEVVNLKRSGRIINKTKCYK